MRDYSRTEINTAIDEYILNQKHREIMRRRLIDYSRRGGYSRRSTFADGGMSFTDGGSYADGSYVRPDGSYRDGGSYARGRRGNVARDSMGRYSSANDQTVQDVRMLLNRTQDENARQELSKLLDKLENM